MRSLTPVVESALRWFEWTHRLVVVPMMGARYERESWPRAGGAGEQDAWLTAALEYLRMVYNAIVSEEMSRHISKRPRATRGRR